MVSSLVQIKHLSHRYNVQWAVKDLNFEVAPQGVTGLLGSNGAGKSTTMNILCGVLHQTEGQVIIGGIDLKASPQTAKRLIGFLPQNAPLLTDLTVNEYLRYCAELRLMPKATINRAINVAKEKCGLDPVGNRLIKNLSGGYKQRVGIAQAIVHGPRLVVLDEPTNGLDPVQIVEVRKLIQQIGSESAVILSSHILSEIDATCEEIKMIEHGRLIFSGSRQMFRNYIRPESFLVTLKNPPTSDRIMSIPEVKEVQFLDQKRIRVRYFPSEDITEKFIQISIANDWRLQEIYLENVSLDEIFANLSTQKQPQ